MLRRYVFLNHQALLFYAHSSLCPLIPFPSLTTPQDGKPYIVDVQAGKAFPDQRAQGYTLAIVSIFKNKEDMTYYDEQCEAHASLKKVAGGVMEGRPLMVYYESIQE